MQNVKDNWNKILDYVREACDIEEISFQTWLKPLEISHQENNTIYISTGSDNPLSIGFLDKRYKIFIKEAIGVLTGNYYNIEFIKPEQKITDQQEKAMHSPAQTQAMIQAAKANLNPKYTFDTFVVGSNNRFAHSACLAVAESPGESYNPLYIYGGPGLGKTHLMHSIGHFILEHSPNTNIIYVTAEEFTNEVIESIRSGSTSSMSKFRDKYRKVDVLMVDDIQFIIGKDSTQEEFFFTFNGLHSAGKQIIISSDKSPKEMETLESRIKTRFEWGLLADIGFPDYETRMAILRKKLESSDITFSDDILSFIATNIKSNVRELEGALNKLIAYSKLINEDITIETAEKQLQNIISPDKPKEITAQLIIEVVSDHFQVSMEKLLSTNRSKDVVRPRQIAMFLCNELTDSSSEAIGNLLGGRDHSTVLHGAKKISEEYHSNEETKNLIDTIIKKINPN
ncbi:chromosomal replication initiator protein DnaA [Eubacterium oxidoreducens]|uniref:Chromosomal replication initiator protein DnaA n=1 Tax=Eubacterium oxidoreducens TaxID=1732 RepID=A0A1G6CPL2_EUBOX|nr:chromosomal replication initiator protein DnaA [Eubacterium oxidoreducens]SDB34829.1 chromosomal replication initiator protein [Eubacterium oxidoreducens]